MASGAYKKAFTGLTGMAVSRNPTHTLGVLYRCPGKQKIALVKYFAGNVFFQQEPACAGQDARRFSLQVQFTLASFLLRFVKLGSTLKP